MKNHELYRRAHRCVWRGYYGFARYCSKPRRLFALMLDAVKSHRFTASVIAIQICSSAARERTTLGSLQAPRGAHAPHSERRPLKAPRLTAKARRNRHESDCKLNSTLSAQKMRILLGSSSSKQIGRRCSRRMTMELHFRIENIGFSVWTCSICRHLLLKRGRNVRKYKPLLQKIRFIAKKVCKVSHFD